MTYTEEFTPTNPPARPTTEPPQQLRKDVFGHLVHGEWLSGKKEELKERLTTRTDYIQNDFWKGLDWISYLIAFEISLLHNKANKARARSLANTDAANEASIKRQCEVLLREAGRCKPSTNDRGLQTYAQALVDRIEFGQEIRTVINEFVKG